MLTTPSTQSSLAPINESVEKRKRYSMQYTQFMMGKGEGDVAGEVLSGGGNYLQGQRSRIQSIESISSTDSVENINKPLFYNNNGNNGEAGAHPHHTEGPAYYMNKVSSFEDQQ
jgi:hypothetical protein